MRTRSLVAAVLLLTAGCGASPTRRPAESPEARAVRATVQRWLSSLTVGHKKGDNARACAYLTPALRKSIDVQLRTRGETATCRTFAANWTGGSTPPGRPGARITTVVVTRATAQVGLAAPPDRESEVRLRRVDGRWLIDNY